MFTRPRPVNGVLGHCSLYLFMQSNLKDASFTSFIDFLFMRPIADQKNKETPWYSKPVQGLQYDSLQLLGWYTQLFCQPEILLERYSLAQLEQGFWAIQSILLPCSLTEIIADPHTALAPKKESILSCHSLYEILFSQVSLETASFMWWDSIVENGCFELTRQNAQDGFALEIIIFETLGEILYLDSSECQNAALHGLGHLNMLENKKVINDFLNAHPMLDESIRNYALECLTGDIA